MRYTHATSAAAVFLAAVPAVELVWHLNGLAKALGAVLAAGCGLIGDMDHPGSTVARTFGWPTRALAHLTAEATDGHRGALHSWVGIWGFTAAAALVTFSGYAAWALATAFGASPRSAELAVEVAPLLAVVGALALGLRGLGIAKGGPLFNVALFAACGLFVVVTARAGVSYRWVPAAYLLGTFAHVWVDSMTEHGCPWLWPFSKRDFHFLGMRIDTGKRVEKLLVAPFFTVALAAAAVWQFGWWPTLRPVAVQLAAFALG